MRYEQHCRTGSLCAQCAEELHDHLRGLLRRVGLDDSRADCGNTPAEIFSAYEARLKPFAEPAKPHQGRPYYGVAWVVIEDPNGGPSLCLRRACYWTGWAREAPEGLRREFAVCPSF